MAASNPCDSSSPRAEEGDLAPGVELHLGAPDGTCKRWLVISSKQTSTSQNREGFRALEIGVDAATPEGEPPFTGRIAMIYTDVVAAFHKPA